MSEVKFWNGVYWNTFEQVTCPRCKHYIAISQGTTVDQCPVCEGWFNKEELNPYYNIEACDYDPKRFKRDWIVKDEEFDMSRLMGNKV